jgi:transcriptional regulator with XRE-family HTH domain
LILHLREQSQLTIDQVAEYLGLTISCYLEIEHGRVTPPSSLLLKLATLYARPSTIPAQHPRMIININSGAGSNSNSGYIHSYQNEGGYTSIERRLLHIEEMLKSILLQLADIKNEKNGTCDAPLQD